MKSRKSALAFTALALAAASFSANAQSFSNTAQILNQDNSSANPYPSEIVVSGLTGNITNVSVTLNGISHTFYGDLNVLVIAPGGQKIALMQRIGTTSNTSFGCGSDLVAAVLTFEASAAANMAACPTVSGTYLPTQGVRLTDSFAPAPAGPYSIDLTSLNGVAAGQNGTWRIYVSDHAAADTGNIAGGWTLNITTDAPTATCASEGYTGTKLSWCKNICEMGYTGATLDNWIHRWVGRYRDLPYCAAPASPPV